MKHSFIITPTSERSKEMMKNIQTSFIGKFVGIISTLLIMPITINYVNPTQYGIWLTISSIIGWISFFDLGLGNGFRNRFAEARAKGNNQLARQYLSTTYFAITLLVIIIYSMALLLNSLIDWSLFLHVNESYRVELQQIFAIIGGFFCLNMIVGVFGMMLTADQKAGWAAMINGGGQLVSLMVVFILTKVSQGSLVNLALYFSGVPSLFMLVISLIMFRFTRYREFIPHFKDIRINLIRNILSLGIQFFIIYLCIIAIFQMMNIIISREIGPYGVTQYNAANRYFNVIYMIVIIIVTPFWSAFTDAYTKKDYLWMKNVISKLEKMWIISVFFGLIMLLFSSLFYHIWLGDSVKVPFLLSLAVFFYIEFQTLGGIYTFLIDGIGTIKLQTIVYVLFMLISWPTMVLSCRYFGIVGIVLLPTVVYIVQSTVARLQLKKLMRNKAQGIWGK